MPSHRTAIRTPKTTIPVALVTALLPAPIMPQVPTEPIPSALAKRDLTR